MAALRGVNLRIAQIGAAANNMSGTDNSCRYSGPANVPKLTAASDAASANTRRQKPMSEIPYHRTFLLGCAHVVTASNSTQKLISTKPPSRASIVSQNDRSAGAPNTKNTMASSMAKPDATTAARFSRVSRFVAV